MKYYIEESSITHLDTGIRKHLETLMDFCRVTRISINLITFFSAVLGDRIISMLTNQDQLWWQKNLQSLCACMYNSVIQLKFSFKTLQFLHLSFKYLLCLELLIPLMYKLQSRTLEIPPGYKAEFSMIKQWQILKCKQKNKIVHILTIGKE